MSEAFQHEIRKLVDDYRGRFDDDEIAVELDAVRLELEKGNYRPAHKPEWLTEEGSS